MSTTPPPTDLDAEASVLTGALADETGVTLDEVRAILAVEDFYSKSNGFIFEAMCELADAHTPLDIVAVARRLKEKNQYHHGYFEALMVGTPASLNVTAHAESVREKSRLRQVIARLKVLSVEAYGDLGAGDGVQRFLEQAEQQIAEIAHTQAPKYLSPFSTIMPDALASAQEAQARGNEIVGVPTGYDLDRVTSGLHDGDFRIVAGRPGSGKSAFILAEALRIASKGYAVPFFSLEMPELQIGFRAASTETRITVNELRNGKLGAEGWKNFTRAVKEQGALPIWVDDTPTLTFPQLRARVRRLQTEVASGKHPAVSQGRIGAIYVDYLQLMQSPLQGDRFANRENLVSAISRAMKTLAMDLKLPVTAVSQLNREVEKRSVKEPQLADLRESGSLEQDADTIIFLYRPEYYYGDKTEDDLKGKCKFIVAKQRNGKTASMWMRFTSECTRFDNLDENKDYDDLYDDYQPG